jgi:uncharacterized coiled-coil protein SlyX
MTQTNNTTSQTLRGPAPREQPTLIRGPAPREQPTLIRGPVPREQPPREQPALERAPADPPNPYKDLERTLRAFITSEHVAALERRIRALESSVRALEAKDPEHFDLLVSEVGELCATVGEHETELAQQGKAMLALKNTIKDLKPHEAKAAPRKYKPPVEDADVSMCSAGKEMDIDSPVCSPLRKEVAKSLEHSLAAGTTEEEL